MTRRESETPPIQLPKITPSNVSAMKLYRLMLKPCTGRLRAELVQADSEIQVGSS